MKKGDKRNAKGISFEKAVSHVQKLMGRNTKVNHNEWLQDRLGQRRQFDVVIRGKLGGHELIGVIECKNWKRRVGTPEVDAFVTKTRDLNANFALIVSKKGFTKPALKKAKDHGVGTFSLLPSDPHDCGFSVGVRWYAEIYRWPKVSLVIALVNRKLRLGKFSSEEINWSGHKVLDWFQHELVTTYANEEKVGWFSLPLIFQKPRRFKVAGVCCLVKGIKFKALRTSEKKTRWVQLHGTGFFDWTKEQIIIPPKASVYTDAWRTDFSDWNPYEGDIPPSGGFLDWRMKAFILHFEPKTKVIDLRKL